ncbi:hypothetical protein AB0L34_22635 [Micromonospora sp. NPDC052213]|uniref:hypothetical protein n=1 Tax=Micromonospora sp. NPDC052213 TaxID=3155812 RepID=UPI0034228BCE
MVAAHPGRFVTTEELVNVELAAESGGSHAECGAPSDLAVTLVRAGERAESATAEALAVGFPGDRDGGQVGDGRRAGGVDGRTTPRRHADAASGGRRRAAG